MGEISVPEMGEISGEEVRQWESRGCAHEENILVSVRLRPLNEKEIARKEASDWECINTTTIIFKNASPERSIPAPAYSFDKVFGSDSTTKQVYMEGAKKVALSVLDGINSSIFAYGQTSSGKTYTMTGITGYTVADIYDYIDKHKKREFILKFAAIEIYNEAVRDLISSDSSPLRLLDDPERGTIVEKLTEETLRDHNHLMELLSICEAQRQLGDTSLNETSSRSHQILRLTIESSAREFSSVENSSTLSASVNFVDLAGSERASQTMSAGARLKEGCHINRSLLTLGTVIRKLSKGRNVHVPYRDSKLTRILQNSLGGNARTAIICTMSPSQRHVEQSRNTLLFACCAKEVTIKAQVNVVMSDKTLVKHLQREIARLEFELKISSSPTVMGHFGALLKEREVQIEKLNKEIEELTRQRDLAQSHAEELLSNEYELQQHSEYSVSDSEYQCKDVTCIETDNFTPYSNSKHGNSDFTQISSDDQDEELRSHLDHTDEEDSEKKLDCRNDEEVLKQKTMDSSLLSFDPTELSPSSTEFSYRSLKFYRSTSCNAVLGTCSPSAPWSQITEKTYLPGIKKTEVSLQYPEISLQVSEDSSQDTCIKSKMGDIKPSSQAMGDDLKSGINVGISEDSKDRCCVSESSAEFERQRRDIIQLWDAFNVPLTHRTYFFLLFNGEPSDSIYMEVELRRLSFLKDAFYKGATPFKDKQDHTFASSARALRRERVALSKQIKNTLLRKEIESVYNSWGIGLKTKQRRLQLAYKLWTDAENLEHAKASAAIVAKLVGFTSSSESPKEMFGLSFIPQSINRTTHTWRRKGTTTATTSGLLL